MTEFINITSVLLVDEPRDKRELCIQRMIPTRNVIAKVIALNQKSQCTEECPFPTSGTESEFDERTCTEPKTTLLLT